MRAAVLLILFAVAVPALCASDLRDYGQALPFHAQLDHPWAGVLGRPFPVRFTFGSKTGKDFVCTGRVFGDDGSLLLSGDWDLVVQEVSAGQVIASRSVRPPGEGPAGNMAIPALVQQAPSTWDAGACFTHAGSYRLRLTYGGVGRTGELFRVDTTADPPPWISFTMRPDQPRAMFGAPVRVSFIVANHGSDDYHVCFGGDYRGSTRALRFHFTAVRNDGAQAWDPEPRQVCFGGIGTDTLAPGRTQDQVVTLNAYLRFPGPGTYAVTAYHNLGFGVPVLESGEGHGPLALAGTFTITLEPPSPEGIAAVIADALGPAVPGQSKDPWSLLAHLHEPFFLTALRDALRTVTDRDQALALIDGVDSIDTPAATRTLIERVGDPRPFIRERALIRLRERAPLPRAGRYPQMAQLDRWHDARAALDWNDLQQQLLMEALPAALVSEDPGAFGAAVDLACAVGGDGVAEAIAQCADRFAPALPVPESRFTALNHLENGAYGLGRAGQPPCRAEAGSSPGRLLVWASMIQGGGVAATTAQEDLLMRMLASPCLPVRRAALRTFSTAALARLPIPWQALFMDDSELLWSSALQCSMAVPLAVMRPIILACPQEGWDERKKLEFTRMLALRAEHEEGR